MSMNVKPIPTLDERINDLRMRTAEIVNDWIVLLRWGTGPKEMIRRGTRMG